MNIKKKFIKKRWFFCLLFLSLAGEWQAVASPVTKCVYSNGVEYSDKPCRSTAVGTKEIQTPKPLEIAPTPYKPIDWDEVRSSLPSTVQYPTWRSPRYVYPDPLAAERRMNNFRKLHPDYFPGQHYRPMERSMMNGRNRR